MIEMPADLMATPRSPHEMRYRRAGAVHPRAGAVRGRRQRAEGRAGAEDRDPRHLPHHRAVRRATGDEHAARRRRPMASASASAIDDHLPDDDPADQGGRGQGAAAAGPRRLDAEHPLRHRRRVPPLTGTHLSTGSFPRGRSARDVDLSGRAARGDPPLPADVAVGARATSRDVGDRAYFLRDIGRAFGDPRDVRPRDDPADAEHRRRLDPARRASSPPSSAASSRSRCATSSSRGSS